MENKYQKTKTLIEKGAKYIGFYEEFVTSLSGENVIEAIKDFNRCYNSSLSGVYSVKESILYKAKCNKEPDVRGNLNNSYFHEDGNFIYNEDEETAPILKIKPEPIHKKSWHGYIDRNGKFYPCGFEAHKFLAIELFLSETIKKPENYRERAAEKYIDKLGWVKISDKRIHYLENKISLSNKQKKAIINYMGIIGDEIYEFQYDNSKKGDIEIEIQSL